MFVASLEQGPAKPATPDRDLEPERGRSLSRRSSRHSSDSSSGVLVAASKSPTNERRAPSASPPGYKSQPEPAVMSRSPSRSRSRAASVETPPLALVPMPPRPHGFLDFEDLCVYPSHRSSKSRSRSRTPPLHVMTHSSSSRHRRSSSSRSPSRSRSRPIMWTADPRPIITIPQSRSNSRSRPSLRRSPTRIIFERSSSRRSRSCSPSWSRSGPDHVPPAVVTAEPPRPPPRSRSRSPRRTPPVVITVPPSLPPVITPRCASPSPPRQRGGSRRRNRSRSPPVVVVVQQPPYEPIRSPLKEFYPTNISPLPSPRVVPAHHDIGSHAPTIVPAPVADGTEQYMTGRIGSPRSSSPYGPPFWMGPEYAVRRRSPSLSSEPNRGSVYYSEILPSRTQTSGPRHPRFWFEDGNLSFSVEGYQYNVHRYLFPDFDASFYQNHPKDALDRFLSVLYPNDYLSHECKTTSEWTSVLEIAHPRHPKVARLAIHQLSSSSGELSLSPVEKLRLAQKCGIDAWIPPAFHQLVLRTLRGEPLDVEEGRKVGVDVVVRIGMVVNAVMRDLVAYLDEGKVGALVERQVAEMRVRK
uniref:BTB domain-containing protein n=1 Tax=Mycena chlorophos TaxID=658473 RepID=A0ABQ0LKE6_MYCCL|nr:predicted protein [Mycena chlorophos]